MPSGFLEAPADTWTPISIVPTGELTPSLTWEESMDCEVFCSLYFRKAISSQREKNKETEKSRYRERHQKLNHHENMKHQKANFLWMKPKYFPGKEFCKIVQTAFQPQNSCPSKRNLEETSAVEKGDEQVCLAAHSAEAGFFLRLPRFQYPGRLRRQDVVFWLFLRSKEPKIIAKALLLVFSWQYGDILFGLERDWCGSFSGRRKSPKQGGGPHSLSHIPAPAMCWCTSNLAFIAARVWAKSQTAEQNFFCVEGRFQKTVC